MVDKHRHTKLRDARESDRVRKWLEIADDALKGDGLWVIPEVNWNVLISLRREHEHCPMASTSIKMQIPEDGSGGEFQVNGDRQCTEDFTTIMALIQPVLDSSLSECTKRHNSSLLR